ncbi:hypothetical protein EVAR_22682_1 [Eumeta japonica]|uniref:Peptidase A2 domain-containing protein n=1 Tax=Eumeta variegata TaxID=151549 RepID=A0A4C1UTJ3_EUMVA|nr:hypothetical protein EVAR_22682_1 [Eumeta japonica]
MICYYHCRFGAQARNCTSPCLLKNAQQQENERTLSQAERGVQEYSHRLCVTNKKTGLSSLVDTGANISVLPRIKGFTATSLPSKLYAANKAVISTYGEKALELDFNLQRQYKCKFTVANVSKPIPGADFLKHHQLVVVLKSKKLMDNVSNLKTNEYLKTLNMSVTRSIDSQNIITAS